MRWGWITSASPELCSGLRYWEYLLNECVEERDRLRETENGTEVERRKGREIERKIISYLCILHMYLSSIHLSVIPIYPSSIYPSIHSSYLTIIYPSIISAIICLSIHTFIHHIYPSYLYIHPSIQSSIHSFIYPSIIYLSIHLFNYSSVHSLYLTIIYPTIHHIYHLSIHTFIHIHPSYLSIISIYPSIHPVVYPFIYPSYLSIYHLSIDLSSAHPSYPSICLSVSISRDMSHTYSAWVQAPASCWCLWKPFITDLSPWNSVGCGWIWVLAQLCWWGRVLSQACTGTHLLLWRLSLPPFHTTSFCRMPGPPWHTGNSCEKNSSYIFLPSLESLLGEHFGQYPKPSKTVIFFNPRGTIWNMAQHVYTDAQCLSA